MRKIVTTALLATMLAATGAAAQSIQIGPGGVQVDPRSPREQFRDERRGRAYERELRTGSVREGRNCRTVTVREEDDDGNVVRRSRRECR